MQLNQVFNAVVAVVGGVGVLVLYFWGSNFLLERLLPDRVNANNEPIESREKTRERIRPWLFVGPALIFLTIYLVYPAIQTFIYSFGDSDGYVQVTRPIYPKTVTEFNMNYNTPISVNRILQVRDALVEEYPGMADVTAEDLEGLGSNGDGVNYLFDAADVELDREFVLFRNYQWAFDPGNKDFWEAVRNNIFWLLVPFVSTAFGLLIAVLADGVRWGSVIKSLIFLPMAISFIGAGIVWRFVYDYRGASAPQIGVLNAIVVGLGGEPQPWLNLQPWNNFFLMIILVWIQTGFAMVLLSAALRGVPEETLEAARIDGANEVQIFFRVIIPQIMSTILVVLTTITIVVLKVFDIVFAITNGQSGTQVLANLMYNQSFVITDDGRGAVVSIVLMVAVIPVLVWNIRQFRRQEQIR